MTSRWLPLGLLASSALATTLIAMDVPALTRTSDLVVRGTVVRVESRWTADGRRIMTDNEILVGEVLKGSHAGKTIVAMQPGGTVGDVGQVVHGVATFALGDEVVVFLERRGDRATVVGFAQGRFFVDRTGPEPMVRGGEEELFLVDAKTHQPVAAPTQAMSLSKLEALVRQHVGSAPEAPALPGRPAVTLPKVSP